MVLSNKKIKERLRALRAEIVVASEAGKNPGNSQDAGSKASPAPKAILSLVSQKPRLSKRVVRRQRVPKENFDVAKNEEIGGDAEPKEQILSGTEEVKEKAKRKRDESEASEELVEEKPKKERKKRWRDRDESEISRKLKEREARLLNKRKNEKKRKLNKQAENGEVKEGVEQSESEATGEQLVAMPIESAERKDVEASDKIYVGGIPYYSTEDDIRSYFESCGTITGIDCMTFPDTGKFRGIAIITFKTEAAAKRGLALDGSDMGGLFLKIQPFKSSKASKLPNFSPSLMEGYNRIYAGNLSWDVTEDDLRNLFAGCTIESIRFGEDKETKEFKGYAHVDFGDTVSLNTALKLDQKIVCGRPVRISYAVPKKGTVVTSLKQPPKDDQVSAVDETPVTVKTEANAVINSEIDFSSEANANVGAKIRRRTCYECGERGHISSLCPKKKADNSVNPDKGTEVFKEYGHVDFGDYVSANNGSVTNFKTVPKYDNLSAVADTQVNWNADSLKANTSSEANADAVSSKIRRRTCYECGERGHISSLCPKKKADDSVNPDKGLEFKEYGHVDFGDSVSANKGNVTNFKTGPKDDNLSAVADTQVHWNADSLNANTGNETNADAVVSSKIRRRTCYECGKRGHISSLCPEKKEDNLANKGGA